MLAELIDKLTSLGRESAAPKVTELPGGEKYVVAHGGEVTTHDAPNRRAHECRSLASIQAAIERWCESGTVWHNEVGVVVATDDTDRRDTITLPLIKSEQFSALANLTTDGLDHKAFVRLLRHTFANAGVEHVLNLVRKVTFKRASDGTSDVQHGRESLGRAVEEKVTATSDIPETVRVTVPVYETDGADFQHTIDCSLDINMQSERFVLMPLPGELAKAMQHVQSEISGELNEVAGDAVGVFYGSP